MASGTESGVDATVDMDRVAALCQRYGIAELSVFGSRARGTATTDSDVDLLYVLSPDSSLGWDIGELEESLSRIFGHRVELVSKKYLHPRLRPNVLAEAKVIYVA